MSDVLLEVFIEFFIRQFQHFCVPGGVAVGIDVRIIVRVQ